MSFFNSMKPSRIGNALQGGFKQAVDYNNDGKRSFGEYLRFGVGAMANPTFAAARVAYNGRQGMNPWASPYQRQEFGLSAQQPQAPLGQPQDMFDPNALTQFGNTGLGAPQPQAPQSNFLSGPRITPQQMPVRNDLDFMNTQGSAYQSRYNPVMNPSAMQSNNGYFDMNKAGTVNGNWVQDAGWRTDANKAFGQNEEDMAFNASMAKRIGSMSQ